MRMKISNKPSGGVISSFFVNHFLLTLIICNTNAFIDFGYVYGAQLIAPPSNNPSSPNSRGNHDEFDFEFLGTGNAAFLQTNVFANDDGHREQKIQLWFDPSQDFHTYELVWNPNQIAFNVDGRPVRVFNKGPGVNFASRAMHVEASIWNVSWAGVVDWSKGPFIAYYQGFDIVANQTSSNSFCKASLSDGTVEKNWELSPKQQRQYEEIRKKYLIWDYCSDKSRDHPECEN
ncbi:xyloglucan endotransglucosylase/hydrolase 4 [Actinidia rufa]|uniref:Xyloglucan endotransglucosylase/hydrolase n=1 Tax=Actinidia rufa TaxID=165716 RepID=A0A7J0H3H2_9ERIC|nr:xyloglucan endotransglucosylase/hydrolase 4 [Actinidia rufa]